MNIEIYPLEKILIDHVAICFGMEKSSVDAAIGSGQRIGNRYYYLNNEMAIDYNDHKVEFIEFLGGVAHSHLRELYLHAAVFEARLNKNSDQAFEYFKKGFEHKKLYDSIRCTGEYQYTSPLVAKVTFPSANFPSVPSTFWKGWVEVLPEDFKERIKSATNYAECFE